MTPVTVTTHPRLHLGLHDCGYATNRLFGGIGIAFRGFPTTVTASASEETKLDFSSGIQLSDRALGDINQLLSRLESRYGTFSIEVVSTAPEHRGFGSKTSLLLAIAWAVVKFKKQEKATTPADMVQLTGRGGTSGIGVNSFWYGGLIADGGHKAEGEREFAPSAARSALKAPPIIARHDMPADWCVQLFYDPDFRPVEGAVEKQKFKEYMPLPDIENLRAVAATYHGLIPAVIEQDLGQFASALQVMNMTGMKRIEVDLQTERTKNFLRAARKSRLAAGLTSFGPTVFVINESGGEAIERTERLASQACLVNLGKYEFDNTGMGG